ncbi:M24 family metallopeptidase [Longispora fulva]|uniref:Xaa-Pro aminopeptidase n=1 Tax=Longispora fulva TaxID=619741 RepID=A0A8J7G866_9ACTN|nr:M24 family metallopeptidase [Longispora fulva]MBG6134725.1 Xaa-Pro aminopeptidase [Longispora fulva]
MDEETERAARLLDAQGMAADLFAETERRGLIAPGRREQEVSDDVRDLAGEIFGVSRHWHKRIVRSGPNTLQPYRENPPDRVIGEDDIVFCDFGPVFAEWEADFGRTYVLGDDPVKHRLRDDLPLVFEAARRRFAADPAITGERLFAVVRELTSARGWEFGGPHAGHLVGEFPHERIPGDQVEYYITPGSDHPMRRVDSAGRRCHWILEIHLVDRERGFGGFHEELLDLGHDG